MKPTLPNKARPASRRMPLWVKILLLASLADMMLGLAALIYFRNVLG